MAWERRKRGGLYYTRSRRVGGRVVREYIGCGPAAELFAAMDELDRERRETARADLRYERERLEGVLVALRSLGQATEALVASTLEAAGFRRHKGQWRRRRA